MQQKFLMVLSSIIVGLAILAGVRMSQENLRQVNRDAVIQDLLVIASRAQAWYRLPPQLEGGGSSFANLILAAINFDSVNANGSYALSGLRRESFRVTGTGLQGNPVQITLEVFSDSISSIQVSP